MEHTTTRTLVDDAVRAVNNLVCHVIHHDRLSPLGDKLLAVGLTASQWDRLIEVDYLINSVQDDMGPSEDEKLPQGFPPPEWGEWYTVFAPTADKRFPWLLMNCGLVYGSYNTRQAAARNIKQSHIFNPAQCAGLTPEQWRLTNGY